MKTFFSIILAVAASISTVRAGHDRHGGHGGHGGYHGGHGGHFSSISPRGGHNFSRGGSKFSRGGKWSGGKWSAGKWSGGNWSGGNWSGDRFIFSGGFGYPYYGNWYPFWSWGIPYVFNYGYYSNGYYPSYGYGFGYPYYGNWYPSWSWSIPYAFNYDYYSSGYNPSYQYDYDYYSDPAYGYADRSSIAQLQSRLARAGYYYGAIDGIMGPQTRRAIRAYERAYGELSMR
jgi:Putative peptidoglycan binding domain